MKRNSLSDQLLAASVATGLAFKFAALAMLAAPLLRWKFDHVKWRTGHAFLLLSALWGATIVAYRGIGDARSFLLQQSFLWVVPFVMLVYRPSKHTVESFRSLIYGVFAVDLAFNLYAMFTGVDLLGRTIDEREGLAGARLGGLFGHSFYSGSISMLAYIFLICGKRTRWLAILPAANLIMAGSFRFAIPLVLVPYFFWRWQRRGRASELRQVVVISAITVLAIVVTSSFGGLALEVNPANDLRVFAWANAMDEIAHSPWSGVGYPNVKIESGNADVIRENLIGESWYLSSALTFGVPYMIARLAGLLLIFYRGGFENRSAYEAVLVPIVLVDLVYGQAFEGLLFYATLWVVIDHQATDEESGQSPVQARKKLVSA